jgi:hypothetical protein
VLFPVRLIYDSEAEYRVMTTAVVRDFGNKRVEKEHADLTISMINFLLRLLPSGLLYRIVLKGGKQ